MSKLVTKNTTPLTPAQKAAARKERKAQRELEARLKRLEEEARARAATAAREREEDQRYLLDNREALLALGQRAPVRSGRRTFANAGCVAVLSALVAEGPKTRDQILRLTWDEYRFSYRHAGFLLGHLRGPDAKQHLWYVDGDRRYHLHRLARQGITLQTLAASHLFGSDQVF